MSKVQKNSVVSIDYTLTDDEGEVLDTSKGQDPLSYLHGHGQIVPGLERALEGKAIGDSVKVVVEPKDGYGQRDQKRVMHVNRAKLPSDLDPEVGMQLAGQDDKGQVIPLWITQVSATEVTLDGNHPLAGQTLHFDVQIKDVRQATEEELHHGHAHGPGGHH
jgi:FKBP-type peptidyl-prolyl cis-trans isomerase SlyD